MGPAGDPGNDRVQVAQAIRGNPRVTLVIGRRVYEVEPEVARRFEDAASGARETMDRLRELDPAWKPTPSIASDSVEGAQARYKAQMAEADARLKEILRDAIPNTNPSWGVNRLRKELNEQGYKFVSPTDAEGFLYRSEQGAEVRIMAQPVNRYRTDPSQKFFNDYYYRYRAGKDLRWGVHTTIPNKSSSQKSFCEVNNDLFE